MVDVHRVVVVVVAVAAEIAERTDISTDKVDNAEDDERKDGMFSLHLFFLFHAKNTDLHLFSCLGLPVVV